MDEGEGTVLSDGRGRKNSPRNRRKFRRGWGLEAKGGKREWSTLPIATERTGM